MRIRTISAAIVALGFTAPALAGEYNLTVDRVTVDTGNFTRSGIGYNGATPGPVLRFKEGEDVVINVTNNLDEDTSVHWHGLILPYQQDGVPGISYPGIAPGETFTYRFPIMQNGTYWFHSHSGFQEPDGAYGSIIIEPREPDPNTYDREYVVQLTDAHPHSGDRIMRNLKMMPDYYNRKQRTLLDFFDDASEKGVGEALSDRGDWGEMRMMPTDIEDVHGYTPLINGKGPEQNWTGLFRKGERVRLRFINSSAMTYFDLRIPGLEMTVVQADGQNVQPVVVDELRIAVAETYDVIVQPTEDRAYTIFGESMGRTAFARGTLAPREGMTAQVPELREDPLLTMADMGMPGMDMSGMDMSEGGGHAGHGSGGHDTLAAITGKDMDHSKMGHAMPKMDGEVDHAATGHAMPKKDGEVDHAAMGHAMPKKDGEVDHAAMGHAMPKMDGEVDHAAMGHAMPKKDGEVDHAAMGHAMPKKDGEVDHAAMGHAMPKKDGEMDHSKMGHDGMATGSDPFYAPGSGLTPEAANGGKFLSYADLKAQTPLYEHRPATREIELKLTGNMERYMWSLNGVKYEDADPIVLQYGERVRFKFVNTTMMTHPMHLHGMWSILDVGAEKWNPIKHVVSVAPGTTVYMETEVDAPGEWAFHCHLSYHADTGMFRKVIVEGGPADEQSSREHSSVGGKG
ncbi:MAG: copper resistance system multicopper oxidase [Minwuia sp.]|uniref:copper resistance system multicopper oxidase n=1 Tax=Minwuia sp. TaxID=2493630 RepID=UPI003A89E4EB